jgi:hypothetical protein
MVERPNRKDTMKTRYILLAVLVLVALAATLAGWTWTGDHTLAASWVS